MRAIALALFCAGMATAGPAPLFTTSNDAAWKKWDVVRGSAQLDAAVKRDGRAALRIEGDGSGDAWVRSAPVTLRIGAQYELSGWVKTDALRVHDTDRSPIAVGAALSMASMPFD